MWAQRKPNNDTRRLNIQLELANSFSFLPVVFHLCIHHDPAINHVIATADNNEYDATADDDYDDNIDNNIKKATIMNDTLSLPFVSIIWICQDVTTDDTTTTSVNDNNDTTTDEVNKSEDNTSDDNKNDAVTTADNNNYDIIGDVTN